MKKLLKNASDIANVPVGYSWESELIRAGFFQTVLFALATGDWNKIHINPLTLFFFKSNLGGMTYHGDLVLSLTKKGLYRAFAFEEDTEVIALSYDSVEFKRPLHIGTQFRYRHTLLEREIVKGKAKCKWQIEVVDGKGKLICTAVWVNGYYPVAKSEVGKVAQLVPVAAEIATACGVAVIVVFSVWAFNHQPPINKDDTPIVLIAAP